MSSPEPTTSTFPEIEVLCVTLTLLPRNRHPHRRTGVARLELRAVAQDRADRPRLKVARWHVGDEGPINQVCDLRFFLLYPQLARQRCLQLIRDELVE